MNNFSIFNFNTNIYKAISACGYTEPTPVQSKSIPIVMSGKDVAVSAQTGTGKTASFVLPALHKLSLQAPSKKTRVLILTPTRELASQITKAAGLYGRFMRFNIVSLVGGMSYHHQIKDLARGADILVATPGRLLDHIEQKRVDLSHVEMLVLDEADRMLDMGFIDDVQYIAKLTPAKRQTLLFSATLDNKLMKAVHHLLKNPERIDLSHAKLASPLVRQEMYKTGNIQQKTRLLKQFLSDANIFKAIIFSATKANADKLAHHLRDEGFAAAALHGDLRQNVRNRTLEQLRRGKVQFLVATDVAARGIDVSDITHVFNYDLPRSCEDYVHRIGRTGRAGKTGVAISFVLPADFRLLQSIERLIGQRFKLLENKDAAHTTSTSNDGMKSEDILTLRRGRQHGDTRTHQAKQKWETKHFHEEKEPRENDETRGGQNDRPRISYKPKKNNKQKKNRFSDRPGKDARTSAGKKETSFGKRETSAGKKETKRKFRGKSTDNRRDRANQEQIAFKKSYGHKKPSSRSQKQF